MRWPTLKVYDRVDPDRPASAPRRDFEKSYLGMRLIIGTIGIMLPALLVVLDFWFLDGEAALRGSMSAYYHSGAHDLFVGGLTACGVALMSHLWWRWDTWDFWVSLAAGLGIIGVAAFPTGRADVDASAKSCTEPQQPKTPDCAPIQGMWGEGRVETLHFSVTVLVVVSFAALCLIFALRDFGYGVFAHEIANNEPEGLGVGKAWARAKTDLVNHLKRAPRTLLYLLCFAGVAAGGVWASFGQDWLAPNGYTGEFLAFVSFGSAWIVASWDLYKDLPLIRKAGQVLSERARESLSPQPGA